MVTTKVWFSTSFSRPRQAPGCATVSTSSAVGCCYSEMSCAFHRGGWWAPVRAMVCTVNRGIHAGVVGGSRGLKLEWGDRCWDAFAPGTPISETSDSTAFLVWAEAWLPREDFPAAVVIQRRPFLWGEPPPGNGGRGTATTDLWAPGSAFIGLEQSSTKDLKATGSLHAVISKCSLISYVSHVS